MRLFCPETPSLLLAERRRRGRAGQATEPASTSTCNNFNRWRASLWRKGSWAPYCWMGHAAKTSERICLRGRAGQATEPAQANATTSIIDGPGRRGVGRGKPPSPQTTNEMKKDNSVPTLRRRAASEKRCCRNQAFRNNGHTGALLLSRPAPPPFPPKNNLKPKQLTSLKSTSAT